MGSISVWQTVLFDGSANEPTTLEEVVFQALGAASMCWKTIEGASVFDSELANAIGHDVIFFIKNNFEPKA